MYNTELPNENELPSSQQLLRSTIIALITGAVLLVTTVLPAEYGIDPTGVGRVLGLKEMGMIKMQLAEEAAKHNAEQAASAAAVVATPEPTPQKSDTTTITLKPNEGVEYKLEMAKGAKAKYEWTSVGGPVNHNLHTDGAGGSHSYSKGTGVERDAGEITAVSDGYHGWFWRNRNSKDVTITLKTSGDYKSIKRM
ncbi:MAG: transmembrane anchor protein [Blastocatellia bacterium]|nr:transmembrane anchor protein [Blastocatellia bacterium]